MIQFSELWKNYPDKELLKSKCTNKQQNSNTPFSNYCAIMMSECFIRSGVNISMFQGNRCWSHSGKRHVLLAEDLANGLKNHAPPGFGKMEKIIPNDFQSKLDGKKGVIFFKDYWQRSGENMGRRSGDHIDLWNESRITNSSMLYRSVIEFFGLVSDLNKSKEIWFWEVR